MPKPNLLVMCPPDHYVLHNLDPIREAANIFVSNERSALLQHAGDAEIVLCGGFLGAGPSLEELWPNLKRVRWIHSLAAGVEKLLFPALAESPVTLTNARGVFKRPLAEFVIAGMLYFYKCIRRLVDSQRTHRWDDFLVDWLLGKTMGVVGYGEIGRECALLAKPFGVKIYATRRKPELSEDDPVLDRIFASTDLHSMLREVDVVVAAAPLTPQTHHMLSDAEFGVMKPSAIVINVGRGPVVDQAALVRALQEKRIRGAALDVFEQEPLPPDHPLWDMENVLISPHNTDRTRDPDWLDITAQCFVENFGRYVHGQELLNIVDKRAGY